MVLVLVLVAVSLPKSTVTYQPPKKGKDTQGSDFDSIENRNFEPRTRRNLPPLRVIELRTVIERLRASQIGHQVPELRGFEWVEQSFGHQRQDLRLQLIDAIALDGMELTIDAAQRELIGLVAFEKAIEDLPLVGEQTDHLIAFAYLQTGREDVSEQRPDLVALVAC